MAPASLSGPRRRDGIPSCRLVLVRCVQARYRRQLFPALSFRNIYDPVLCRKGISSLSTQ